MAAMAPIVIVWVSLSIHVIEVGASGPSFEPRKQSQSEVHGRPSACIPCSYRAVMSVLSAIRRFASVGNESQ